MIPVPEMTEIEKTRARAWIENWERLGPKLDALRLEKLRSVNTAEAIESLQSAYRSARLHCPSRRSSGLVEQQRWFMRARR